MPKTAVELPAYPASKCFPSASEEEFGELVESIRANGLRRPITTYVEKGKKYVLCGRRRQAACLKLGIALVEEEYIGNAPIAFIVDEELQRRHLSASQKAAIAAALVPLLEKESREAGKNLPPVGGTQVKSAKEVKESASAVGASARSTERALAVEENASPAVMERVRDGSISLRAAEAISKAPKAKQAKIARQVADGIPVRKAVAEAIGATDCEGNAVPENLQGIFGLAENYRAILKMLSSTREKIYTIRNSPHGQLNHKGVLEHCDAIFNFVSPMVPNQVCGKCGGDGCGKCKNRGYVA